MTKQTRIAMALAALLLLPLYIVPFWTINMEAPQYPGGLGMYLHIDNIEGHNRHDIRNINTLNHYIGMQEIHSEDFWEFEVLPWVIGVMIALGLAAAFMGSLKLTVVWLALMLLLAIAGLTDFYLWGYDYGHNLNPDAPIRVPGMSYQPPLIGCKQLLNMYTCSWPYTGSIFVGGSLLLAAGSVWFERRKKEY